MLNKLDLLPADERRARVEEIAAACGWNGPAYGISALVKEGVETLARDCMRHLEARRREQAETDPAVAEPAAPGAGRDDESGHRA